MKTPPYQLIANVGSILLVMFVIAAYRFLPGRMPEWGFSLAWVVAGLVTASLAIELWLLWRDFRSGVLFPMRNASLFILLLSVVGMPTYLIYLLFTGQDPGPSTLLLLPVFLAFAVRNLFRIRIDNLTLRAKTGFRSPVEFPLFDITAVEQDDRSITVQSENGRTVRLLRAFFFPGHWERLSTKLSGLSRRAE
ncbi:hypothetical protein GGR28_001618 [Lewinella aquimaris]|uniref:Uncharacterized protein n=1 Tax=Neolewinella aquimaris TaxID=1835722 RepID=A0A840E1C7_9BACT|nr:hypothetical protein [Neolewinella aquimaris]MBB4079001.1 hypothetical protein [Neolewinella aquimaris]